MPKLFDQILVLMDILYNAYNNKYKDHDRKNYTDRKQSLAINVLIFVAKHSNFKQPFSLQKKNNLLYIIPH